MRGILRVTALVFACVASVGGNTSASWTHWAPQKFEAATATAESILAALSRARGTGDVAYAERTEDLTIVAGGERFAATLVVRGEDFRFTTTIDGETYASGRAGGIRWRRTSTGVVHLIEADTQGDDLDRWPLALFAATRASTSDIVGSAKTPVAASVVVERSQTDSPHWFYLDDATGAIVREVVREGSRTVDIRFSDFRSVGGIRRAFGWHLSGAGGDADVRVEAVRVGPVAASDVVLPETATAPFVAAAGERGHRIPFGFERLHRVVDARVDGRRARLLLDTGTPQIALADAFVRGLHHPVTLGHAVVDRIEAGDLTARHVSVGVVPLEGYGVDGILGYDFFLGHVIHIDYRRERIDWIARDAFEPDPTMHELDAPAREGMPVVAVGLNETIADRFVLDTGSYNVVLLRSLLESVPGAGVLGIEPAAGGTVRQPYLEGAIFTRRQIVRSMRISNFDFRNVPAQVEVSDRSDAVFFPIDGILGTELLGNYEWWFDESAGRVWFR